MAFNIAANTNRASPYWERRALRQGMRLQNEGRELANELTEKQVGAFESEQDRADRRLNQQDRALDLTESGQEINKDELAFRWAKLSQDAANAGDKKASEVMTAVSKAAQQADGIYESVLDSTGDEGVANAAAKGIWDSYREQSFIPEEYNYERSVIRGLSRGAQILGGKPSERDKKLEQYQKVFDVPLSEAIDLVDGNLSVTSSADSRGFVTVTNERTKEAYKIPAVDARKMGIETDDSLVEDYGTDESEQPSEKSLSPPGFEAKPIAQIQVAPGVDSEVVKKAQLGIRQVDQSLAAYEQILPTDITDAAGVRNMTWRGANSIAQLMTFNAADRFAIDQTDAENKVNQFNQTVRAGLVNSDRFPQWEARLIEPLLPDPNNIFKDPEGEAMKMSNVLQMIQQRRETEQALLEGRKPRNIPRTPVGIESDPIIVNSFEEAKTYPTGTYVLLDGQPYLLEEE